MTDQLLRDNARYSNYEAANRMRAAGSVAQGLNAQAQSMDFHANGLANSRRQLQGELDRYVIKYLGAVNELVASIPGFEESGLGKVKDLAFDPATGTDKSFDGPLIYSLTFIINNQPVDVRLTDLEQLIEDDFKTLISEREAALRAAREMEPDKYLASLKEKLEKTETALAEAKVKKGTTKAFSDERKAMNSEISRLKARKSDLGAEIAALSKTNWGFIKRDHARDEQAAKAAAAKTQAASLLKRAQVAQEVMHKLDKEALDNSMEQIKALI